MKAIIKGDLITGKGYGFVGVDLPVSLENHDVGQLRFNGVDVVDVVDVVDFFIDGEGAKHIVNVDNYQALSCGLLDVLALDGGVWRVVPQSESDINTSIINLKKATKKEIESGLQVGDFFYPTTSQDQANLNAVIFNATLIGDVKPHKFWCRDSQNKWVRKSHTAAEIEEIGKAIIDFIVIKQDEYEAALALIV